MAESEVKRLSKVAKELNVGLSNIVEFLAEKGHVIEKNPNAKIPGDLYALLLKQFSTEKAVKEESAKLAKPKKEETAAPAVPPAPAPVAKKVEPEPEPEPEPVKPVKAEPKEAPVAEKAPVKEEEPEQPKAEEVSKVKVIGKIDLPVKGRKKKAEPEEPKAEEPKKPAKKEVEQEKPVEAAPAPEEVKPPVAAAPEVAPEKREDENFIKTNYEKLQGPNIVGRIVLPVKDDKKKPVASSASYDTDKAGKKKRKRIRKPGEGGPGQPGTAAAPGDRRQGGGFRKGGPAPSAPKAELTEEEIQARIKETLARLSGAGKSKASKHRRLKRDAIQERMQEDLEQQEAEKKIIRVTEFVSANELASMMNVPVNSIISTCMSLGMFVSINQRLNAETISIVAEEFGHKVEFVSAETTVTTEEEVDTEEQLKPRAPIVTVMGHVDHGKTSLLDFIRNTNVIGGEAGGITQHIGAYSVKLANGKKITFLDTPGHEAFTAMRARGAQVTDIVIIVIAADDQVMPQTREAINHAQAAGVPIVFAFNKMDKPGANADKIREQLAGMNILVEEWGGKYQTQEISAKKGTNVDQLLEKVLLEADLLDLKANPDKNAVGTVIESSLDKGRGYVSTILVQSGTLKVGDIILAGSYSGRVKALQNERGATLKDAGPSMPAQLLGLNGAPTAGDTFKVMDDERVAREIAAKRLQLLREQGYRTQKHITLDEIGRRLAIGDFKELNIIVKGDVDGSIEALTDSLLKLSTDQVQVNVIHKSVGQVTESDVLLASASNAIIVAFQVRPSTGARKLAETEQIDIRTYSIIYDAINEVKAAIEGMLAPEFEEKIVANVEVRQVFRISKVGTIAGCMVLDGKITRNTKVRVIRNGIVIHSGELGSLKRHKDDAKEVNAGYECGLNIEGFNDIEEGDIIEGYENVEVKRKTA